MTQLDNYITRLKNHDWYYMYADGHREFQRGKEQWMAIAALRAKLDPDYTIFNEHAPQGMKVDVKTLPGAAK